MHLFLGLIHYLIKYMIIKKIVSKFHLQWVHIVVQYMLLDVLSRPYLHLIKAPPTKVFWVL
jgi:hypothetical protein